MSKLILALSKCIILFITYISIPIIAQANIDNYSSDNPRVLTWDITPLDTDNDGIDDRFDRCPNTQKDALVESNGCLSTDFPVDSKTELYFLFDKNESKIKDQYYFDIINLGGKMLEDPNLLLEIKGYASDSLSDDLENLALSNRRANTVKDILIRSFNIQPIRISAKGYGNEPFVFSKNHYFERQLNRSVYIVTTEKIGIVSPE
jgi:OOP family OmpA-OmpF porin